MKSNPTCEPEKKRRGRPRKTPIKKEAADIVSPPATEDTAPDCDGAGDSQKCLTSTPRKGSRSPQVGQTEAAAACLTSTPVRNSSTDIRSNVPASPLGGQQEEYTELITQLKTSEVDSTSCKSKSQSILKRARASKPRKPSVKVQTKKQPQACGDKSGPPAKRRRGRPRKNQQTDAQEEVTALSAAARPRPRFELETPDSTEQESLVSSDLSIELSHHEEQLPCLSFQEEEEKESDDEEELPSFLTQEEKKTSSIKEGGFVWHKCRNYPFWPALVKRVNRKQKKASILFIDDPEIHKRRGCNVALKSLRPLDCEESEELLGKAKEKYDAAIDWCWELIKDYRIRIACGSFSGSFLAYFAHDMSYPVRRTYPQAASERLTIASEAMLEVLSDECKEDSIVSEKQEEVRRSSKRLLPDRSSAAHNRANEKLVHFIVKQRMVDGRLLAVICGQQQSRWLRSSLNASRRRVVNVYLEDDRQLDQVYKYLSQFCATAVATSPCLEQVKHMERVPFVLDVLLPEAIIYAIAGVDNVSVKKAEEKYLRGRCISNRERQEFDLMIERQMRRKAHTQSTALFSDTIS